MTASVNESANPQDDRITPVLAEPVAHGLSWWATLWVLISLYSFAVTPIPSVNEPHYFCMARHFIGGDQITGDLFLDSTPAHVVFFSLVGPLTLVFSLPTVAAITRVAVSGVLAWGMLRCGRRWGLPANGVVFWWGLFVLHEALFQLSGEWIFGGAESKVAAYGLVFAALADWSGGRNRLAMLWLGLSVSLHPIVGGWFSIGILMTACFEVLFREKPLQIGQTAQAIGLWVLASLPGLIPALSVVGGDPKTAMQAAYIQVFYRLSHHLDPLKFSMISVGIYVLIFLALLVAWWKMRSQWPVMNRLNWLTISALIIALTGVALAYRAGSALEMPGLEWRVKLLRFYPFRLIDVWLPFLGLALLVRELLKWKVFQASTLGRPGDPIFGVGIACVILALMTGQSASNPSRYSQQQYAEWQQMCDWIEQNTPEETLFLTPRNSFAFKWYAKRGEYVCFKDMPQDAASMVEWNRRLNAFQKWASNNYADQRYDVQELTELQQLTGADYLLVDRLGPMEIEPLQTIGRYKLYELP